ncbi:MAG: MFS transporter [Terriglobia bacterium]
MPTVSTPQRTGSLAVPWYREMTGYHWWVLCIASLGWLFDTMDQRLFVLARQPAMETLLPHQSQVQYYSGIATAIFMLGWAIGGLYFGMLSDRWGRTKAMMAAILVYAGFTGLSALAMSTWDFMAYRFLTGLGVGGEFAAGVALVAETMPVRARPHALGILQALSTVGNIIGGGIGYFVLPRYGWRGMFLAGVFPAFLVAVMFKRLKEPEAWVAAREAYQRGEKRQLGVVGDLFSDSRWRKHTIIGLAMAISGVVGIWGIGFWSPELIREALSGASRQTREQYAALGTILQDAGSFIGISCFTLVTARVGRRPAFIVAFLLALGATILTFGWLRHPGDIYWMIPLLGFCNLSFFGGYSIYFPELYPTRLRSTGVGFCYNVGRVIAALGPFTLVYLSSVYASAGYASSFRIAAITLSSVYLIGVVAVLFAPETKGKPLPEE